MADTKKTEESKDDKDGYFLSALSMVDQVLVEYKVDNKTVVDING